MSVIKCAILSQLGIQIKPQIDVDSSRAMLHLQSDPVSKKTVAGASVQLHDITHTKYILRGSKLPGRWLAYTHSMAHVTVSVPPY